MQIEYIHPKATIDHLGFIPGFLSDDDPRPAKEQFHEHYRHGGGWLPIKGFAFNKVDHTMKYPGDPPFPPIALITLRNERIFLYESAFVAIVQSNNTYEVARMD